MESSQFIIILISLLFSAFFSGMEIAFLSSNKLRIELEKSQGSISAKIIAHVSRRPSWFIGTMLLGNNIALVLFGIVMADVLEPIIALNITSNPALVLVLQTIFSTLIVLFFAEFLPKTVFRINPNRVLYVSSIPLLLVFYALFVFMFLTIGFSEWLLKLFFNTEFSTDSGAFGRVDLDHFIRDGKERSKDQENIDHEINIFHNALDFDKVKARDCMIPRTEIEAADISDSIEELKEKFLEKGLSKVLVYRDSIDNVIGFVHVHEMFKHPESIKSILLPIINVPESQAAKDVMESLTKQKRSIAIVLDEFGGTSGMITVEDIMEEILGEIEDEHDSDEFIEQKISEKEYLFSARLEIDYLNEKYNFDLEESEEFGTLGGLVLHTCGSIPEIGEVIYLERFDLIVTDRSENRLDTVKLLIKELH
jgi:CBS domain containing-hemolysin-like protein